MGMYTEIQGTVEFKSQEIAEAFVTSWEKVAELVAEVKPYVGYSRLHWIPFSGDSIKYAEGSIVKFHSELKNYDHTIEKFLEILPLIANRWMLESKYEEFSNWTLHINCQEDVEVNGTNAYEAEWEWPKKIDFVKYPDFDVFDEGNLK